MTLTNVYEMAEGRFDEECSEDAYLADIESNFDNEESQIIDDDRIPVLPPAEQYCLKCLWLRPSLFTILEERTDDRITNEMSIPEECERMHDLFEEEGFEDAPLSDVESNFDEEGLITDDWCTPVLPPAEQYCLKRIWARPAPSTISEERTDQSLMVSFRFFQIVLAAVRSTSRISFAF
ncbi:hypothetical protein GCK32_016517 [Trichostrongylus colubriformis]|uniref:Uncharacterized protein n=1 Tax=Trichostrongylus colubriformis TaxID=6319 RepID=A0AAN8FYC8_TRICO